MISEDRYKQILLDQDEPENYDEQAATQAYAYLVEAGFDVEDVPTSATKEYVGLGTPWHVYNVLRRTK